MMKDKETPQKSLIASNGDGETKKRNEIEENQVSLKDKVEP